MTATTPHDNHPQGRIGFALPVHFSFRYDGIDFDATGQDSGDGSELLIHGDIAAMPFTVESADGRRVLRQLLSLRPNVPCATVRLTGQNMIRLTGRLPLGGSATPSRLVATATAIVASARPLVDVVLLCCGVARMPARKTAPARQDMREVA